MSMFVFSSTQSLLGGVVCSLYVAVSLVQVQVRQAVAGLDHCSAKVFLHLHRCRHHLPLLLVECLLVTGIMGGEDPH